MFLEQLLRLQVPRRLLAEVAKLCGTVVICDVRDIICHTSAGTAAWPCLVVGNDPAVAGPCAAWTSSDDGWSACGSGRGEHRSFVLSAAGERLGRVVTGGIARTALLESELYHLEQLLYLLEGSMSTFLVELSNRSVAVRSASEDELSSFLARRRGAVEGFERVELLRDLEDLHWNVAALALRLHLSKRTLFARIARLGLVRPLS